MAFQARMEAAEGQPPQDLADARMQLVEPWKLNGTGEDKLASFGPDGNGRIIQIRLPTGRISP